ncbi:hypothetical protein [Actinoplanes sp. NPDC051851]|uniref:hypothetical protein n=1 Tax=Actinoplanes sp. NPDC051851 TaxID=3154753 RepID=UPI0034416CC4
MPAAVLTPQSGLAEASGVERVPAGHYFAVHDRPDEPPVTAMLPDRLGLLICVREECLRSEAGWAGYGRAAS